MLQCSDHEKKTYGKRYEIIFDVGTACVGSQMSCHIVQHDANRKVELESTQTPKHPGIIDRMTSTLCTPRMLIMAGSDINTCHGSLILPPVPIDIEYKVLKCYYFSSQSLYKDLYADAERRTLLSMEVGQNESL